ncbi:MAG: hypothetical protein Q8R82_07525 [Hyphomonadaceae bacterium]|nr:hypothetical protein [Hyphomonadaceae bacterium]
MIFGTILRLAAAPLAVLALTAGNFHGDRASIIFPDGWSAPEMGADGLTSVTEPGISGANCNVQTVDIATLEGFTLAQINADTAHPYSVDEWADFLALKPEQIVLDKNEVRPFADAWFHIATLRLTVDSNPEIIVRYGFYILPGRVTMAGCYIEASKYATYSALFDTTIASLRPW